VRAGVVVAVMVLLSLSLAPHARANETDPWYAWLHPPRDGTDALNKAINERFTRGLSFTNDDMTCRQAAERMTMSMRTAAFFFFLGDLSTWGVDYTPRTASEYFERTSTNGSYRHVYGLMPLDPAMRSGDVLFGTDKLGHFFTNGLRQYDTYVNAREGGASDEEAMRRSIEDGIHEEETWLGLYPSGIFSYADLEANHQGVLFYRALCGAGEGGDLARTKEGWTLQKPFDIARWVSPCWDEAYRPSYFSRAADAAKRGLREMCSDLARADVHARLDAYRAHGCASRALTLIDERVKKGELPDPSPWSFSRVCAEARAVGQ
jgi:hypothetical protein